MILLESALILTSAMARSRSSALRRDRLADEDARFGRHRSHRTMPATPSTAHCEPSGILRVASSTPSTIGMPRSRASEARCEVEPPSSATTPATRGRMWLSAGPATRVTRMSPWRDARQFAFAVHHHGAAGAPADAGGMAVEAGMIEPDGVRHDRRLDMQRPRLQQLEAALVHRPFDLDRLAGELLALAQQAAERHRLAGRQTRLAHQIVGHQLRRRHAVLAGVAMALAAGFDRAQEAVSATARCGRAPPRPARSPSRAPRWPKSASGLRRSRSSRRPTRARKSAAGSARPSRCRPATGRDCPCSGAHARSTAPPSRRAPR